MNNTQNTAPEFMMAAAELARDLEAVRKRLSELAALNIDFKALGMAASLDEQLRRCRRTLELVGLDLACAMRDAKPVSTNEDSTSEQQP